MKKIIEWFKSSASDFILFLILLVLLNFVGSNAYIRADLTKQKSYSLSKASKTIVKILMNRFLSVSSLIKSFRHSTVLLLSM